MVAGLRRVIRRDWLQSSTASKGTAKDPLERQRPQGGRRFSDTEISELYRANALFANIIDAVPEDACREWIEIDVADTAQGERIRSILLQKLDDLDARGQFQDALRYERMRGDGFIAIGTKEKPVLDLAEPINTQGLSDVLYLHAFSRVRIKDADIVSDPFSPDYGTLGTYYLQSQEDSQEKKAVDASRIIHLQTRPIEGEKWGIPLIERLYDCLTVVDNAAWSIGQILYSMVHKVLKSDEIRMDAPDREKLQERLEQEFNTLTLALIGKNDEFSYTGPVGQLGNVGPVLDFVWELLAAAARMPKSHIIGQQSGTIAGAQYDSLNYYARVAGIQENYLRPEIERLIYLVLQCQDMDWGGSRPDPEKLDWSLSFRPLWRLDRETDAKVRKLVAETDAIYLDRGVIGPSELREKRFGDVAIFDALDIEPDELEQLAERVHRARLGR